MVNKMKMWSVWGTTDSRNSIVENKTGPCALPSFLLTFWFELFFLGTYTLLCCILNRGSTNMYFSGATLIISKLSEIGQIECAKCLISKQNISNFRGGTVMQWLNTATSQQKGSGLSACQLEPLCVESACSPHACKGFLQTRGMQIRSTGYS